MIKPRLLDLGCCAGGASYGLDKAGFDVTGLDIKPQKHYPFKFILGDMLTYPLEGYDAYWCSPPCQEWTVAGEVHRQRGKTYPALIVPMRERLMSTGKPWIMENVPGSPLNNPLVLCGTMFNLPIKRHRLFECSFSVYFLPYSCSCYRPGYKEKPNGVHRIYSFANGAKLLSISGHNFKVSDARLAMGIDWMIGEELAQAIPWQYSEFLGKFLMQAVIERKP